MAKGKNKKPKHQNTPAVQKPGELQEKPAQKVQQTVSAEYYGPIPPSKEMAQYGQIDPSFPHRILEMAELEQRHRHKIETSDMDYSAEFARKSFIERRISQIFALIIAIFVTGCGTYLILNGHPVAGSVVSGTCLVGLVSAFIAGRAIKADKNTNENNEK